MSTDTPKHTTADELLEQGRDDTATVRRPTLQKTAWTDQHEPRFAAICERVSQHGGDLQVLEVGGEPYQLTNRLLGLECVDELTVIDRGTDADRGREERVRLPNGTATRRFCNVEAHAWPIEGSAFDVVVMGAILEHLFHPAFALHQARMAVREGGMGRAGRLILSTPNGLALKQRLETALGLDTPHDGLAHRDGQAVLYDRHQHEYSRTELVDLLSKTGWHCHPGEVASIQLAREGRLGRLYERVADWHESWGDQWVVDAHAGTQWAGRPLVYREGVRDRHA